MTKFEQVKIQIDQIDFDDRSYLFTFEPSISNLVESIKQIGIIHTPILEQKSDGRYRIVSGWRRIHAIKHLNISQLFARVHLSEDSAPILELFLLNFYENVGTRNLNIIEKSLVIDKLINLFHLSADKVISEFFPLLDLGANKLVLDRYLKLVRLEDNMKQAVAEDFISIDLALALLERNEAERQVIFEFVQALRLGKNQQKELMRLLSELSEISDQSIAKILKNEKIQAILLSKRIAISRKIDQIKDSLKRLRFPLFAKAEESFQNLKEDLKLPSNITFRPPPFFETEDYKIELKFKNQAELKKLTGILTSLIEQNKLAKLETLI